jgi:hypothetical protein
MPNKPLKPHRELSRANVPRAGDVVRLVGIVPGAGTSERNNANTGFVDQGQHRSILLQC